MTARFFHTCAKRVAFSVLSAAGILAAAAPSVRADEITVVIKEITALDAADVWIAGPDDFYARVTINGEAFTTPIKRQRNVATPNWEISKSVSRGTHDVRLEIFDKDIGKADDKIDINRVSSKRDLDFTVDTRPRRCRIGGFSETYRCGQTIRRSGDEQKKAEIIFSVRAGR